MDLFALSCIVQICLAYGMTSIFWPEKLKECTILWFPFFPTHRMIRHTGVGALCASGVLFLLLLSRLHQV